MQMVMFNAGHIALYEYTEQKKVICNLAVTVWDRFYSRSKGYGVCHLFEVKRVLGYGVCHLFEVKRVWRYGVCHLFEVKRVWGNGVCNLCAQLIIHGKLLDP